MGQSSRRCFGSLALTGLFALALLAASANALDTGPHGDMTESAMRDEGFNVNAATIGRSNNWFMDMYGTSGSNPYSGHAPVINEILGGSLGRREHWKKQLTETALHSHFDSTIPNASITKGSTDEWDRIRSQVYWLTKDMKSQQDPLGLLTVIGMSLHIVQDFYAHTNFTEPKGVGLFAAPGWDTLNYGLTPTWWDIPRDTRDTQDIFTGTTPGHRVHGYFRDPASKAMAKDWPGANAVSPNVYTNTYMAGYFASRQWVQAIRMWLDDEALWAKAQRYARYASSAKKDAKGGFYMSTYTGHWQGQGEPWSPDNDGHRGYGGSLVGARQMTKWYFEHVGRTPVRKKFEALLPLMWSILRGRVTDEQAPVPSSLGYQSATRFVRYQVLNYKSNDLTDPGPDDADNYSRAKIAGQEFISPILQAHDRFSFGSPYYPFTFIKPVARSATFDSPVREITVRLKTSSSRYSGTDDNIYLRISRDQRFQLDKRLFDDFERGDDDTYSLPIDAAARAGLSIRDIRLLRIEKSSDGIAGGYKLGEVTVRVNGVQVGKATVNKWLEDDHRTYTIPGFKANGPRDAQVPVWMDLREDDIFYGGDDQGDVNRYDARNAVVTAYHPGSVEQKLLKGGSALGGRLNQGGDKADMTYKIETFDTSIPQLPPPPTAPDLIFTAFDLNGFTVQNIGNAASGPFNVQIITGLPSIVDYPIAGLAPGASATQATGFNCYYMITGTADSAAQVIESNELNNGASPPPPIC
ncbi:MAG: CARDB domain-containing protein [Solirubrobacterales bacterium]